MPSCSFDKCLNHSGKQKKSIGITFHAFPKDELWRHEWLRILRKQRQEPDWIATDNSRVCSIHFKSEDIYTTGKGLKRIKKGAVPLLKISTKSPDNSDSGSDRSSPNSLQDVDISDLEWVFKKPCNDSLKQKKCKICTDKKKLPIKNKNLKKKHKRLPKTNITLKKILLKLKKKLNVTEDQFRELSSRAELADLDQRMTTKMKRNKNNRLKFLPSLRKFVLVLNLYSPAGYKYVREVFNNCLPHPCTLGKWYENAGASPGFTAQAFAELKKKHTGTGKRLLCTLIVDEIAIHQQSIWNGRKTLGLVNYGSGSKDTDQTASQVFVMMLVSINQNWKLPVGYFFVNGITSETRANLIRICLAKCWEVGVDVVALTFDGCSSNINAAKLLGCQLSDVNNLKTTFKHPSCDIDVAVFLDTRHMMNLVRNTLESKRIFHDDQGGEIKWQYLVNLIKLQESETLNFTKNLTPRHIHFRNKVMKVKLATQLLSISVATALKLSEQLLSSSKFVNTEATVKFIENLNHLVDMMNSRKQSDFGFKKPICADNKNTLFDFMNQMEDYICSLKIYITYKHTQNDTITLNLLEKRLVQSACKTGFIGFIICIESLKHLYSTLVEANVLEYISMYRLSLDHLKLFFGVIREQGGHNNDPNAKQFQSVYRKALGHLALRSSLSENCIPLDNFLILNGSSAVETINRTVDTDNINSSIVDLYDEKSFPKYKTTREIKKKASVVHSSDTAAETNVAILSDLLNTNSNLSTSSGQMVGYISGWVARALIKTINCETCVTELITEQKLPFHKLIALKNMGGVCYPSYDLFKICVKTETALKMFIRENVSQHFISEKQVMRLKLNVIECFVQSDVLSNLIAHSQDQPATYNHGTHLLKAIIDKYCDVRLQYKHKADSAISKTAQRQKHNKLSFS